MRRGQWFMVNGLGLMFLKTLILFVVCLCVNESYSQHVSTIISKEKIVIGEQISLQIKVQGISHATIKQDFMFPDSVNHIEFLSDSIQTINNSTIVYNIVLTSFDSGYWQLPVFEMILHDNRKLSTEPIGITVMPVDISTMSDYHDIKDILEVNPENNWWIIAVIVFLALISLFGFLWFHKINKESQQQITSVASLDKLYNELLLQISKLETTDKQDRASVLNIYKDSASLIKEFIDVAFSQKTLHLTTGEYILKTKGKFSDATTQNDYFQFLRLSDAVKFAKYFPPAEETNAIFPSLKNIATTVYNQTKSKN